MEIMASRSNVILAAKEEGVQETVAACAYQVSKRLDREGIRLGGCHAMYR